MTKLMTLHQVAELLAIPPSTLRYWDKQGLIQLSRGANHYRQISLHNLVNIIDVMQFREMDISIEQVKQTPLMDETALLALLAENKTKLTQKIKAIKQIIHKIELKQRALNRVMALKNHSLISEYKQLGTIYQADLDYAFDIQGYLSPFQSADIYYPSNLDHEIAGMFCPSRSKIILREADNQPRLCLTGLMYRDNLTGEHNLAELCHTAVAMGYQVEQVISQFLAFANNQESGLRDYFEVWLMVEERQTAQ
ncbi:MerR family transcriptional regulator [Muribacter muris]|nr:MerR family transcriptional regulator [Muribacter muris]MBF0784026.1 MerR family transcriptional regulator [Muribacter muris]MBF0827521.1 MerR family transcriptional regulator [Muribacter muris]